MKTWVSQCEQQTEAIAAKWAQSLVPGDVVALFGDLGVGKTAFTRGLAAGLGYNGRVTSPTFTILHEYNSVPKLFHYDLYRIGGVDELDELGFYDTLEQGGITVIEWSERIAEALPLNSKRVMLARSDGDEQCRVITIEEDEV